MKTSFSYHQGRNHAKENVPCQDYAAAYCDELITAIAVADGCSSALYASEAAHINVETALSFVSNVENWRKGSKEELISDLIDMIEENFYESGLPVNQLSATLCVAAVKLDGEYLLISIGDSSITAFDSSLEPLLLVEPYNGSSKSVTVFTNDRTGCLNHAEIRNFSLRKYDFFGFAVYTDGCEKLFSRWLHKGGSCLRQAAAHTLLDEDATYLKELMMHTAELYTNDDVSLAIVIEENQKTLESAVEILSSVPQFDDAEQDVSCPDLSAYPIMYHTILKALMEQPMTPEELTDGGYLPAGKVLETMTPLLRLGIISWKNGVFCFSKDGELTHE